MQNDKRDILKQIYKFQKMYKSKLENKDFLIVYKNFEETKKIKLSFTKENFLHLIGLGRGKEFLTPLKFYKKIEKNILVTDDFEVKDFTLKKLSVSIEMIKIFSERSKIAVYDTENKYQKNLSIDNGMALSIPESNAVLGIRYTKENEAVPVSLLKQKLENISQKDTITDIICMFEKNVMEEQYNKIIYNTVDIKNLLQENKELEKLLTLDLLKEIFPKEKNLEEDKGMEVVDKNKIIQLSSLKKENIKEIITVENKESNEKNKIIERLKFKKDKAKR